MRITLDGGQRGRDASWVADETSKDVGATQPPPPDVDRLRDQLAQYMADHGLRSTEQRRAIIETFFSQTDHISIDEMLELVRVTDPRIGYATVYRTMKMLVEAHVANEHRFGDGLTRFEVADEETHHDHLICLKCGAVIEFEEPRIEQLQTEVAARYGFEVVEHKHELYGTCQECQATRN